MTASHARRSAANPAANVASPAASDMIDMFAKRNPETSRNQVETVGRLAARFAAAAVKLSVDQQKRLVAHGAALPKLIAQVAAQLDEARKAEDRLQLVPAKPAELSQGEGLGALLTLEEGRGRLSDYTTPSNLEDWAGPVAGSTELERDHGIARSTLHAWQKQGAVIGLLKGVRKHVFPLDQFIDGRPIEGLAEVLKVIGEPRTAWLWMKEPHPALNGATPLARLKARRIGEVVEAARTNFSR